MAELLARFDSWLYDGGAAALVIREPLVPVEGADGVLFPPTYAASEDRTFKGGYNIDEFADGTNVCVIDSVGSQANRLEPIFARPEYAGLVPSVVVQAGERAIDMLHAGHRAGDALVRNTSIQAEIRAAFQAVLHGDAMPMARIAPTSLVFGAWDSRDTQAKLPRLIASTVRAYNVRKLTRSAQYVPAAEYVESGLLDEPAEKKVSDKYAERGFVHVPASGAHGGVIATGGVRRDATLQLAALRLLAAANAEETLRLRRYVLGVALVAFTCPPAAYLRQGCNLVPDPEHARETVEVHADGRREPLGLTHGAAVEYAKAAAAAFGVGPDRRVSFDVALARQDVSEAGEQAKSRKSGNK